MWFSQKYNVPWRATGSYTPEELAMEYFRFAIDIDPAQALPQIEGSDVIVQTDDAVSNEWEKQIAREGTFSPLNPEDVDRITAWMRKE